MEKKVLHGLCACSLFQGMSSEEINQLMSLVGYKLVSYKKKDIYLLAGMPCKFADIVIEGQLVARMVSLSGKSVEVSRLNVGDLLSPAFIFAHDNTMPVSVETDKPTLIFRLQPSTLKYLIDTNEIIRMNFIRTLSNINVFLTKKMRLLSLLTVREKVASFIIETAHKQQSNVIKLDKSRQEIAESFGIQKFSLLRCMSELVEVGAIKVEGKIITILDKNKM
jgi:putative transcriptional regulator